MSLFESGFNLPPGVSPMDPHFNPPEEELCPACGKPMPPVRIMLSGTDASTRERDWLLVDDQDCIVARSGAREVIEAAASEYLDWEDGEGCEGCECSVQERNAAELRRLDEENKSIEASIREHEADIAALERADRESGVDS